MRKLIMDGADISFDPLSSEARTFPVGYIDRTPQEN